MSNDLADRELRRWCIEQTESHGCPEARITQAASLYEWILGKPKADPEAYYLKQKAKASA